LGTSFGRGGATTFPSDLQNADCILIMGSNMAENHPVAFQWVIEARERGAKVLHVDPRFTRTSAAATMHVPIRPGSDIAFLGGVVRYILENEREFREYVVNYTNAAVIIEDSFEDTEDLDGFFSGWDASKGMYDFETWQYKDMPLRSAAGSREGGTAYGEHPGNEGMPLAHGKAAHRDETLQDPHCVFQLLKKHYRRYTPAMVAQTCGITEEQFLTVAKTVCDNSGRERTTAFAYAVGWTQHSVGVQYIRTAAIVQLLLGNIGRPGGGILALRGHASIQGSTDIPTLYDLLPGYIPMPHAAAHPDLQAFVDDNASHTGFWGHMDAYTVSLLKAYFGENATAENEYGFGYLPRITGDHSHYETTFGMLAGNVKGFFCVGENPAVGSANSGLQRRALAKLDWLVVRDLFEIESASFWYEGPEVETGELRTEAIGTEVFFLPAAAHTEKDGSFTNTQRLLQWHHKAVEPQGDCRSELDFYYELGRRVKEKLASSTLARDRAVRALTWSYPLKDGAIDAEGVLREINGWDAKGKPLSTYTALKTDGSTTCGCWIYCGVYADGVNHAAQRKPGSEQSWVAPDWGWAWPANRRILYNRASADPQGRPWSERKKFLWWDDGKGEWTGYDVPDFEKNKRPDYDPPAGATAEHALSGTDPFIMQADGSGWLFVPNGLGDGPLPAHYEPDESPVRNPLYSQQSNPMRQRFDRPGNPSNPPGTASRQDVFPYAVTTYRLTEHHTAGGMSRTVPHLSELQPEFFCEIHPDLASEKGLANGDWATIVSARSAIEARVLVTRRVAPLLVEGRSVHQVGLPYHWGSKGFVTGDSANDLAPIVLDPNVHIQESKAATCDIVAGRRPRGAALLELVNEYRERAGIAQRRVSS
jgi:formate dehydrogenase major subunit